MLGNCAKPVQLPTPQTPRHRDAISKKVPITPRHRVGLVGKPLTPCTPRTPSTPSKSSTIYNAARQLFVRSADPGRLIGREEERKELKFFLQNGIESRSGRCLYVSGPPGTGKSALVTEVCHELDETPDIRTVYINCMSVKNSKDIYAKLTEDLINDGEDFEECAIARLRKMFISKKSTNSMYVVTLDEIDHLLTLDLEILYTLFEWSLDRSSRLILIGIANALDLTDRFLPRLKARNLKPQFLPFLPYTAPQIASVISSKLKSLSSIQASSQPDHTPFVHPAAIQLCSKKVASQTGDLRKAFDIIRRTIDLVESETKQKHQQESKSPEKTPSKSPLSENPNLSSTHQRLIDPTASLSLLSPLTAPRATIAHIARVSASALSNGTSQRLQILNLQQKAALCALISLQKRSRRTRSIFETPSKTSSMSTAPTIRKLYEIYRSLCKQENGLHPLTATEFTDVIGGLETLGLLGNEDGRGFTKKTPGKKGVVKGEERTVVSWVSESEVEGCLDGAGGDILRSLLRGV